MQSVYKRTLPQGLFTPFLLHPPLLFSPNLPPPIPPSLGPGCLLAAAAAAASGSEGAVLSVFCYFCNKKKCQGQKRGNDLAFLHRWAAAEVNKDLPVAATVISFCYLGSWWLQGTAFSAICTHKCIQQQGCLGSPPSLVPACLPCSPT